MIYFIKSFKYLKKKFRLYSYIVPILIFRSILCLNIFQNYLQRYLNGYSNKTLHSNANFKLSRIFQIKKKIRFGKLFIAIEQV